MEIRSIQATYPRGEPPGEDPLGQFLDQLVEKHHGKAFLYSDPLEFVHRYTDPCGQEATALVAAVLAYGNVKQIRRSVQELLVRLESVSRSPCDFVRQVGRSRGSKKK